MDFQDAFLTCIADADREGAQRLLEKIKAEIDSHQALLDVFTPIMTKIGTSWSEKDFTLAHSYIASKIFEDALAIFPLDANCSGGSKGPIILGNAEEDCHPLGRKMVGTFLMSAGWSVIDLELDVPAELFVEKAIAYDAKIIGVSAMMYSTAMNIKKVREEIDKRELTGSLQLAVGGAVFNLRPELADEVGADGTTANAIQAAELMERLWDRAVRAESMCAK